MSDKKDIIAVAPCGCVKIWHSGSVPMDRECRKDLADCIAEGYEVRHVTTDEARTMAFHCAACMPSTATEVQSQMFADRSTR